MKESAPEVFATGLLSTLQILNLGMIPIFVYDLISSHNTIVGKKFIIIIILFFYIFNFYRYNKVLTYNYLAARWDDEEIIKRKKRGILVISFIFISFIIMLVLATILGEISTGKMKPPF